MSKLTPELEETIKILVTNMDEVTFEMVQCLLDEVSEQRHQLKEIDSLLKKCKKLRENDLKRIYSLESKINEYAERLTELEIKTETSFGRGGGETGFIVYGTEENTSRLRDWTLQLRQELATFKKD